MICETIRKGTYCPMMTGKGCGYSTTGCNPINDKCVGCNRTVEFNSATYCKSYPDPEKAWRNGNCNLASHVSISEARKVKLNPIKASKRSPK